MPRQQIIEAELTWTGEKFERGLQVLVEESGRISAVQPGTRAADTVLSGQALLPGMINTHSHAFQRGLRGRGEVFSEGAGSFWTWREAMYALVERLDERSFHAICLQAFREMLRGGITTVGEFHYFHHLDSRGGYEVDEVVLQAARDAGIRIVLLNAYYRTGGIDQPLANAQQRFATPSLDEYWKQYEHLEQVINPATQTLGVAAHSIRAASIDEIQTLYAESVRRGAPFHMHVEEQQKEIDDSIAAYARSPMELINERLRVRENFTAVHCTRTSPDQIRPFLASGGNVSITPLTEANLGDGVPDTAVFSGGFEQLSLGSDSNARISMFEEMRWLEYGQRLTSRARGILTGSGGRVARNLFSVATTGGARSLGVEAGRIAPGAWADFFTVDLAAASLEGWEESTLLDSLIFGASEEVVTRVCVGGSWQAVD